VSGGPEVVVITGASAGVGRAAARKFARHGARIGLLARGTDGLKAARREVEELGSESLIVPTYVANAEQVEAAAARIESEFGEIDIWINNATTSVFSPVKEMTPEEFRRVTEVTYLGYVYGTLAALKRMLPRDRGVIVQVGSALAYRGIPLQSAYCAAKHAIQGFCDSLRCELLHDKSGVRLTMVQLPALNTPQFGWVKSRLSRKAQPVPPIFQPEIAAEAIYFAGHNPRREFYVGAPSVAVITLNHFVPGLLDRYLACTGYDSQQYNGPEDPNRPDNLWQPVRGDHGAHGAFDARARSWSPQLWTNEHRSVLGLAAVALGVAALMVLLKKK
jgi:NAD(P)-dependent dehydrogenase (short-subunit alcohol dehydrogenase family)